MAYLPDVARLEWAINQAWHADDPVAAPLDALRSLDGNEGEDVTFGFDPSLALVASPWPVDVIWRANQPDADGEATVDATTDPVWLEVRRLGDDVVFRRLGAATFTLRRALLDGECLGAAVETAAAEDAAFDLTDELLSLFQERVLTSAHRAPRRGATW